MTRQLEQCLRKAGWNPGRQVLSGLGEYAFELHQAAEAFACEYGGLAIGKTLFTDPSYANLHWHLRNSHKELEVNECLPMASSFYWGDASMWIGKSGEVYLVDDQEVRLIGKTIEDALRVLVLHEDLS